MDLNDYWQENKRFVTTVASGAVVFLIAHMVLDGNYSGEISAQNKRRAGYENDLRQVLFDTSDLSTAESENENLRGAVDQLSAQAQFQTRPRFRLDRSPAAPSPGSQYLRTLTAVRDDLIPRSNRNNMRLDAELGMPSFSPTREDHIERYLEALDVVDTVVNLAIESNVRRLDKIDVKLDPGLGTRQGVGRIEHTKIKFTFEGPSLPLARLLGRVQRPPDERALLVDDVEFIASRSKPGEARLDLTLTATRLTEETPEEDN